jgi:hypothetical protein
MATEAEKELLHTKAEYLRTSVAGWLNGPKVTRVRALADELDVIAGHKEAPEPPEPEPGTGSEQEGDAPT